MVGEVAARVDVIVPGGDDAVVAVAGCGQVLADAAGHRRTAGHRQRAAFAEIVLHVNDDQRAHALDGIRAGAPARH
jgi:ribosomal protein S2